MLINLVGGWWLGVSAAVVCAQPAALVERVWYDGDTPQKVWMAEDELAIVYAPGIAARFEQREPAATLIKQDGPVAYYKLPPGGMPANERASQARREPGVRHASPVFYRDPRDPRSLMALSGEIIVSFRAAPSAERLAELARTHGVTVITPLSFSLYTYLVDARGRSQAPSGPVTPKGPGAGGAAATPDSLDLANAIRREPDVASAAPNWIRSMVRR